MAEQRQYTPQEEFANTLIHFIGALLSIYAIVMLAVNSKSALQTASTAIFGATMFIMFQSSACYHAMTHPTAKVVFQKIDHSAIYMLIAGTFTPILLLTVKFPHSVAIMAMIWYLAITGIVFSCITLKFKTLSTGLYLIMGWLAIFLFYHLWTTTSHTAVFYFLGGGILYTVGCVFYVIKKPFMHSIWHIFVIAGAVMHYLSIDELLKVTAAAIV